MKLGPDIAIVASLVGDPARANMLTALMSGQALTATELALAPRGSRFCADFGIDLEAVGGARRPMCKACLDWSVRRNHLAGSLGAALLDRIFAMKWARRERASRVVSFTPRGRDQFEAL